MKSATSIVEEVAGFDEGLDGSQPDMVGVDVIAVPPTELSHGLVRFDARVCGRAAYEAVFSVGFVPDRAYGDSLRRRLYEGGKLGAALAPETIAYSHAVLREVHVSSCSDSGRAVHRPAAGLAMKNTRSPSSVRFQPGTKRSGE